MNQSELEKFYEIFQNYGDICSLEEFMKINNGGEVRIKSVCFLTKTAKIDSDIFVGINESEEIYQRHVFSDGVSRRLPLFEDIYSFMELLSSELNGENIVGVHKTHHGNAYYDCRYAEQRAQFLLGVLTDMKGNMVLEKEELLPQKYNLEQIKAIPLPEIAFQLTEEWKTTNRSNIRISKNNATIEIGLKALEARDWFRAYRVIRDISPNEMEFMTVYGFGDE